MVYEVLSRRNLDMDAFGGWGGFGGGDEGEEKEKNWSHGRGDFVKSSSARYSMKGPLYRLYRRRLAAVGVSEGWWWRATVLSWALDCRRFAACKRSIVRSPITVSVPSRGTDRDRGERSRWC